DKFIQGLVIPQGGVYTLRLSLPGGSTSPTTYTVVASVGTALEVEGLTTPRSLNNLAGVLGHLSTREFGRLFAGTAGESFGAAPPALFAELDPATGLPI